MHNGPQDTGATTAPARQLRCAVGRGAENSVAATPWLMCLMRHPRPVAHWFVPNCVSWPSLVSP